MLDFQVPNIIEPDVPISGIRLSDWLHREVTVIGDKPANTDCDPDPAEKAVS
jgi:hypothetical protein